MSIDIASLRAEYTLASLSEHDVNSNPISQFNHWFQESLNSKIEDP
jgi:pyridoxamine 5'-phosphate oxidase